MQEFLMFYHLSDLFILLSHQDGSNSHILCISFVSNKHVPDDFAAIL